MATLTDAQVAYIKEQVEAQTGFTFVAASISGIDKLVLQFVRPTGASGGFNEPTKGNKDWLTDDAQFKAVVADAISVMVSRFST